MNTHSQEISAQQEVRLETGRAYAALTCMAKQTSWCSRGKQKDSFCVDLNGKIHWLWSTVCSLAFILAKETHLLVSYNDPALPQCIIPCLYPQTTIVSVVLVSATIQMSRVWRFFKVNEDYTQIAKCQLWGRQKKNNEIIDALVQVIVL